MSSNISVETKEMRWDPTLTRALLEEQGNLSAVARFARWHEAHTEPALAPVYRRLIPLSKPRPGEQYAFEVDLDKCSGCKACVSACHSLNGLDEGEAWRTTGLLVSTDWRQPRQQTITTACHHCVDPACLNGCPVLAYDKDPSTGIVRHLDDQCIGCQYCVLKCPYEVPKYSSSRGIVRKCDLCSHRLVAGEAPACVQACPNEAIRITLVAKDAVTSRYRETVPAGSLSAAEAFLPESPAPAYTLPTTHYKTARTLPASIAAADREELRPQPSHAPLVFMLVLSQLAVGLQLSGLFIGLAFPFGLLFSAAQHFSVLVAGIAALLVGTLHLGRPLGAWRTFLGLRRSWLSREIVAFTLFVLVAAGNVVLDLRTHGTPAVASTLLRWSAAVVGVGAVYCSAMVYHDTQREFWRWSLTLGKFLGSTALLGAAATITLVAATATFLPDKLLLLLAVVLAMSGLFKLALEQRSLCHLADDDYAPLHKTALLLTGRLGLAHRLQMAATVLGDICGPGCLALMLVSGGGMTLSPRIFFLQASALFVLCLFGELTERRLFFLAVQPVRMPGSIGT